MNKSSNLKKYMVFILFIIGIILFVAGYINQSSNSKAANSDSLTSDYQEKLEEMLSGIKGIGQMKVMINQKNTIDGIKIDGVAVICQGGSDPLVIKDIIGIVEAVCGISSNRIYVACMSNQ